MANQYLLKIKDQKLKFMGYSQYSVKEKEKFTLTKKFREIESVSL